VSARPAAVRTASGAAVCIRLLLLVGAALPVPLHAQRPAELSGRIRDGSGAPVEFASVELLEAGARALSDAAGRYAFRSVSSGRYTLRVSRVGYETRAITVEIAGGSAHELDVDLVTAPVALEGVDVSVGASPPSGVRMAREDIARSGARSAGELLRSFPGVVIHSTTPGGPLTASVRGGAAGGVLVLVDGVALNDPVTGEADLSSIPAERIETVVLLPGAQSARYGPRAQTGVILIETRAEALGRELRGSAGSLGARSVSAAWGHSWPIELAAGAEWGALEGDFDFDLPDEVGGGRSRRRNADSRSVGAWAAATDRLAGGVLRVRGSADATRRGLPGRAYAPSPHARQTADRLQGTASWQRLAGRGSVQLQLTGSRHEIRFSDDQPPFGLPYHDSARVSEVAVRGDAERRASDGEGFSFGGGVDARWQSVDASNLGDAFPGELSDVGLFGHAAYALEVGGRDFTLAGQVRGDRDHRSRWTLSRSLLVGGAPVPWLFAAAALRSSYSPPSLADQYFRDAVGVEPNPSLEAERVPLEVEVELRAERPLGALLGSLSVSAYRGDVRGMIVWAPDFRFVWSPRNVDVQRVGVESRASAESLDGRLGVRVAHSYTRVGYDRPPPDDDVQVVYRPRHTASVRLDWRAGAWRLDLGAHFTGARNTVPARVNALPSFWASSVGLSKDLPVGSWTLTPTLRADRLFDEEASLIFGFPEPGRTFRLEVSLKPRTQPRP
jgi:outer membrane cobalamin receptor